MKLWRGLSRRVVLVGVISTVLLTLGIGLAMVVVIANLFVHRAAGLVPLPPDEALAACHTAPERWHYRYPASPMETYAYDIASHRSANPAAPPLNDEIIAQLDERERPAVAYPARSPAAIVAVRAANAGPCSLVVVSWPPIPEGPDTVFGTLVVIALLGVGLTLALTVLLVLRPMLQRLRKLEAAATGVGDASGYVPLGDGASDEIGSIARVLDRAHARIRDDAARLEAGHRRLEQHLADVAHDLRTPLASLGLTIEEMPASELAGRALGDVVYLAGLVDNLHLATRLADGADLSRGRAELGEIVERIQLRFALLGRERGVTVDVARPEVDVFVACEPAAAERAIANLVHNAVAHGEPGGHVAVVLDRILYMNAPGFRLMVLDDGPGVSPTELPSLSDPTAMSDPARRRTAKGSGLGLVITGEICRRSGWALTFGKAEPRGLEVVISGLTAT